MAALLKCGYRAETTSDGPKTLWVFPYDWTASCEDIGQLLAAFIRDTVLPSTTPAWSTVDVINHSLGGIVSRAAKQLYGAPILRTAYIASPFNGSANAFFALHPAMGIPLFDKRVDLLLSTIFSGVRPLTLLQNQSRRWKSTYELLPDHQFNDGAGNLSQRFPADMRVEIERARQLKARLTFVPTQDDILFACKSGGLDGWTIRRVLPIVRFLMRRGGLSEDMINSDAPQVQQVIVEAFHLWAPSMPVLHAKLRDFLARP